MDEFEVATVGERGQIVIPQAFRDQMHIGKGEKFMIIRDENMLILKRLTPPSKKEVEDMFKRASDHAKKHGLSKKDMWEAIKKHKM